MINLLGWLGTLLVLASYAQTDTVRLRRLSLVASLVLVIFNAWLAIWSNVALEVALTGINARRLYELHRAVLPISNSGLRMTSGSTESSEGRYWSRTVEPPADRDVRRQAHRAVTGVEQDRGSPKLPDLG